MTPDIVTPGLEINTANAAEKAPVSVPHMFNFQVGGVRKTGKSLARIACRRKEA
jgi:hypothetical protein